MKLGIFILIACLFFGCNNSPEERSKKAIANYIKQDIGDPSSYEAIEFKKPDTLWDKDKTFLLMMEQRFGKLLQNPGTTDTLYISQNVKVHDIYKRSLDDYNVKHPNEYAGWIINHKYRAKNKQGVLSVEYVSVKINKAMDTVLSVSNIDKEQF